MRLSQAAKKRIAKNAHANELAAANAHVAQVQRLNDSLRANNAALDHERSNYLERAGNAERTVREQSAAIAAFKREALQAAVEAAEMRGYIARTLEDDAVREVGGAKEAEPVLDHNERSQMEQMLHHDRHARRQPPRSIRRGPLAPPVIVNNHCEQDFDSLMRNSGRTLTAAPTHWLDR